MSKHATSSPLWAIANGVNRGSYEIIKGLKFFVAGAVVASRQLAVGLYKTPEAIRATHLGMIYQTQSYQQQTSWGYYWLDDEDRDIRSQQRSCVNRPSHAHGYKAKDEDSVVEIYDQFAGVLQGRAWGLTNG